MNGLAPDPSYYVPAGMALFLIGANVAFLFQLGWKLVMWFKLKIIAITLLLMYVALSLSYGNPQETRVTIGVTALAVDIVALAWMWHSITRLKNRGVIGLVPLINDKERNS